VGQSPSQSSLPSAAGLETITGWDDRGFATTKVITIGITTAPVSYDQQGFPITATSTSANSIVLPTTCAGASAGVCVGNKNVGSTTSKAAGCRQTSPGSIALLGIPILAAAVAEGVLL
jgi:hypothetical protein